MRDIPRFVEMLEKGQFDAKTLATTVVPLERMLEAYEEVAYRTTITAHHDGVGAPAPSRASGARRIGRNRCDVLAGAPALDEALAFEQRAQQLMQLAFGRAEARLFERGRRRISDRVAERLQLRERGPRVARRAEVLGMIERMLAAHAAQRVVARAREWPQLVRGAAAVDQERTGQVGRAVLLDRHAVDRARVCAYPRLDRGCVVTRQARAEMAEQRDSLVRVDADALVTAERAARRARDRGARGPVRGKLGLDDADRLPADRDARRGVGAAPERVSGIRQRWARSSAAIVGGSETAACGEVPSSVHVHPRLWSFATNSRACVSQ